MLTETRLPDFFVIGAMKAGTTSLYFDLLRQPDIFLPDKESNALLQSDPGQALSDLFASAAPAKTAGEICPDYTKPGEDRIAARQARRLYPTASNAKPQVGAGAGPKLIYVVREPVARLRSHHHFISSQFGDANPSGMTADLERSLRECPELVATSCYASRLAPWVEVFGSDPERLRIVRFEDYIADRSQTLRGLAEFLDLDHFDSDLVDSAQIHNSGASRPVATPRWRKVKDHPLYRRCVRPLLSLGVRERLRKLLLPRPPPPPPPPRAATLDQLIETFRPEVAALSALAGRRADDPLWDLDALPGTADPPARP